MATKRTPQGLKVAGKALWKDISGAYELRLDELRVLEDACREADLIATMQAKIDAPGFDLYSRGSMGQEVIDPIVAEVAKHRALLLRLLGSLKLPDAGGKSAGGETEADISSKARMAANARWSRRSG